MKISLVLLSSVFFFTASGGLAETRDDEVIATLNGKPLYRSEVEQNVSSQLYKLREKIYSLLKMETEKIINRRLLSAEAEKQRLTVKALLKKEVDDKVSPPGDKEVDAFLADYSTENVKDPKKRNRIRTFLHQKALSERKREYLAYLQEKADYKFLPELPEQHLMKVDIEGEPWRGYPDAPVTLVHFASFTCLACPKSIRMIKKAMEEFPGKLKWVHRNFFNMYDETALTAAKVGEFAHENGKFWDFHDAIGAFDGQIEEERIFQTAEDIGLNLKDYDEGEREGRFLLEVRDDIRDAMKLGVTSAPVIFVNGRYFHSTFSYDQLKKLINEETARIGKIEKP